MDVTVNVRETQWKKHSIAIVVKAMKIKSFANTPLTPTHEKTKQNKTKNKNQKTATYSHDKSLMQWKLSIVSY